MFKDKIYIIDFRYVFHHILRKERSGASSIQYIENKNFTFLYLSVYRTLKVDLELRMIHQFSRKAT